MDNSKGVPAAYYEPNDETVECRPNVLYVGHSRPRPMLQAHWHAQVEINYMLAGQMEYCVGQQVFAIKAGQMLIFWGGMAHKSLGSTEDADYVVIHLPLMDFFRMRLRPDLQGQLMAGHCVVSELNDPSDPYNFARWADYLRYGSDHMAENALDELLLRAERTQFGDYHIIRSGQELAMAPAAQEIVSQAHAARICSYIGLNFREEITVSDIADAVNLHPKYAMNQFKKVTGMTLNKYVSLLRLSYAQAQLLKEDVNVLDIAMDAGFGSLSAFNKSFQKQAGKSPSSFRRDWYPRPGIDGLRERDYGRA